MHRSICQAGVEIASSLSRVKVAEDRGHVSSGDVGREGATRLRYHKSTGVKDSRAHGMVLLRINDAFRGRSIEQAGPGAQERYCYYYSRGLILRLFSFRGNEIETLDSLFVLLTHTLDGFPYIFPRSRYYSVQAFYLVRLSK